MTTICTSYLYLNGSVSVISSEPPCKDGNARFTTIPLKSLSDQKCGIVSRGLKVLI